MFNSSSNAFASVITKILKYQILVIFFVSVVFMLTLDLNSSFFSFLGGLIAFLPNLYFGWRLRKITELETKKFINSFYRNETTKLLLTALLFLLVFRIPDIKLLPLLACYISTLSVFWFALLMR
ncbi:MAG: ATP synthase subunit I [Methylococcaceae bacterium]